MAFRIWTDSGEVSSYKKKEILDFTPRLGQVVCGRILYKRKSDVIVKQKDEVCGEVILIRDNKLTVKTENGGTAVLIANRDLKLREDLK